MYGDEGSILIARIFPWDHEDRKTSCHGLGRIQDQIRSQKISSENPLHPCSSVVRFLLFASCCYLPIATISVWPSASSTSFTSAAWITPSLWNCRRRSSAW